MRDTTEGTENKTAAAAEDEGMLTSVSTQRAPVTSEGGAQTTNLVSTALIVAEVVHRHEVDDHTLVDFVLVGGWAIVPPRPGHSNVLADRVRALLQLGVEVVVARIDLRLLAARPLCLAHDGGDR